MGLLRLFDPAMLAPSTLRGRTCATHERARVQLEQDRRECAASIAALRARAAARDAGPGTPIAHDVWSLPRAA
jgi:hypothetical protein